MTQCITKLQSQKKNTCIFVCLFLRHCNLDVFTVKYRILCTFLTVQFAEVEMFPKVLCKFRSFLVKREDFFYSLSLTENSGTFLRSEEQANITTPHHTRTSTSDDTHTIYQVRFSLIHSDYFLLLCSYDTCLRDIIIKRCLLRYLDAIENFSLFEGCLAVHIPHEII